MSDKDSKEVALMEVRFKFFQEGNCMDDTPEEIEIVVQNDVGHLEDGNYFFTINTLGWSFDDENEFNALIKKVHDSISSFKTKTDYDYEKNKFKAC